MYYYQTKQYFNSRYNKENWNVKKNQF